MAIEAREHGRHVVVITIDNQPRLNAMSRACVHSRIALALDVNSRSNSLWSSWDDAGMRST